MKLQDAVKQLKKRATATGIADNKLFQYFSTHIEYIDYVSYKNIEAIDIHFTTHKVTYPLEGVKIDRMQVADINEFIDVCSANPDITRDEDNYVFTANGKSYYFPRIVDLPNRPGNLVCEMNVSKDLYDAIKRATKFVLRKTDSSDYNPVLHCVNIYFENEACIVTANDFKVLLTAGYQTEQPCKAELNIMYHAVDALPKSYPASMRIYDNALEFTYLDGSSFIAYSYAGRYPNYQAIMVDFGTVLDDTSKNYVPYGIVSKQALINAIKDLAQSFNDPQHVMLTFSRKLEVSIQSDTEVKRIELDYEKVHFSKVDTFKINIKDILNYLNVCESDDVYVVCRSNLYLYCEERWAILANQTR